MSKYIDAEKLIALIDAKLKDLGLSGSVWVGRSVLQDLKEDIITSLQQEQDLIIINKKDWEEQEKFRKNKDFGKPLQEEQDYSDLSDLERAIHRGFLCAGVENVPVTIIKETAKEVQSILKAEG